MKHGQENLLLLKLDPGAKRQLQQLTHGVGIKLRIIHPRNHPIHGYRGLPTVNVSYRFFRWICRYDILVKSIFTTDFTRILHLGTFIPLTNSVFRLEPAVAVY